ncbi:hypothetical protein AgCh_031250 [Apium graveolens]
MHKGWHFTLNRDSMSFDSMKWKGLREYRRNDSRITLEVLQGERKGQRGGRHFKDIKISWKVNDDSRSVVDHSNVAMILTKLSKIEAAEKGVVKLWWYSEWKHIRDTKVDEDEVVERKMLGPVVVQKTKDIIDLISQDGHKKYVDLTRKDKE